MSVKKISLSLAVAGLLVAVGISNAAAETDGAFVGVQLGYGANALKYETVVSGFSGSLSETATGVRFGIMGGYKQFFAENFGLRYYGVVDLGADYSKDISAADGGGTLKINTWNINANADALFNFVSNESLDFGAFLGLSLGYASHKFKDAWTSIKPSGFDLGINLGLRTNIAKHHGIELYSRFSLLQQKDEIYDAEFASNDTYKAKQSYAVGLRYVFSF